MTDIVIVKKYYTQPNKTQFREVTEFIKNNNSSNDPIVTSLSWYFPYFLNNDSIKSTIVDFTLDNYVNEMIKDSTKNKSFWYVDAHNRPYKINEISQKYLENNFTIENNVDLYDTWAKHYVKNSNELTQVDISKYQPLKERNGDAINFTIENFESTSENVKITGWAYLEGVDSNESKTEIILIKDGKAFKIQNQKMKRDDVTTYFKSAIDLSNSGFNANGLVSKFSQGKYQIGVIVTNLKNNKSGIVLTDKYFEKE